MKRIVTLMLAIMMVLSMAAFAQAEEPIRIVCYTDTNANGFPADLESNYVYQQILDRTGVAFEVIYLDEYDVALNARIMGEEEWHMASMKSATNLVTYASQEMLLPLTDYADDLKVAYERYGYDTDIPSLYYDGVQYGIPAAKAISDYYYLILVREDINQKYNLTTPTTVPELYDYCKALKAIDVNEDGQDNTIPFTGWTKNNGFTAITAPFGVFLGNKVILDAEGKASNTLLAPRMKEALEWVRKFWADGLVDAEVFTGDSNVKANVVACNVGVAAMPWSNILKAKYVEQYKAVKPDAQYGWIGALTDGKGGDPVYAIAEYEKYTGAKFVINEACTEEEIEAIWKVLRYFCTDEGMMLVYQGQENVHWVYDENHEVALTSRNGEANFVHAYQILGRDDAVYLKGKFPEAKEAIAFGLATPKLIVYNGNVVCPEDYNLADLDAYVNEEMIKFIKGERALEEYDAFIKELYDAYDFQTWLDICEEQLQAQNIAK
ncbi:MAG: hypothetical protein IKW00_04395 [Clostridia bacterium]|nr:hypothetical protein [Clostridia bacterium]